jgi:putative glutamine amidotransferase
MRPVIGFPCATITRAGTLRPVYAGNPPYIRAIEAAGGIPVLLPLYEATETLVDLHGRLDGVLLAGGGDVDPIHYGEAAIPQTQPPDAARDRLELAVAKDVLRHGLPVLGICRGMQLLNVACGGTLYQDIRAQVPGARNHDLSGGRRTTSTHDIEIQRDSRLATIVGDSSHVVNSYHHQAVARPGQGVSIVAWAADGVAEAIELRDHAFALAVQFHPERVYESDASLRRLFEEFVRACQVGAPVASPVDVVGGAVH